MASALQNLGRWFGAFAGLAGIEHGWFELQQGNVPPPGLMFPSLGPPCDPEAVWHNCEPAITLLPTLLVAGIVSILLGALTAVWAIAFIGRRHGGPVLALLSILLLAGVRRAVAALWPWSLVAFFAALAAMVVVGQLSNELMLQYGLIVLVGIPLLMILAVVSAWAHDSARQESASPREPERWARRRR